MLMLPSVRLSNPGQPHGSWVYIVLCLFTFVNVLSLNYNCNFCKIFPLHLYFTLTLTDILSFKSSRYVFPTLIFHSSPNLR